MSIIHDVIRFLAERDVYELMYFFWYFLFFDFMRYIVTDFSVTMVYLFNRRRQWGRRQHARALLFAENPLISVISPGKNEGSHIPKLSNSIKRQTYKNIELIVVDDGSDDDTPKICRRLQKKGVIQKFFRNAIRGGKASAANLALKYAAGKYVIHLDADSYLREDSIENIVIPFYMEPNVGAVGGDIRVIHETNGLAGSLQAIDYFKSISVGRTVNSTLGILRIVAGAYGAFPASLLKRIKGWDVGPGLDGDITYKIRKLRYKTVHEPSAICFTNVPDTFVKLARQRFRWDRSLVRFRLRRHADVLSPRNKSFQFLNFFASLDNIVFNLVLNFKWWVYIFQMIVFHPDLFPVIFLINYLLYLASNMVEFFIACVLLNGSLRRKDYLLLFYLPLMPIYTGFYLRIIRTYAHLMEIFFKMSYEDRWNPWKVSRISKSLDR